jgi:hypothetical protein
MVTVAPGLPAQGPRHFTQRAEEPADARAVTIPAVPDTGARVTGGAVLGATLGLVIGVVGGAVAGATIETSTDGHCSEQCGFLGAFAGAAIGPTFGVPLGLHLADANSHVLESLAISAGLGAIGVATLEDRPVVVLVVPAVRLLIALVAKR